MTEGIQGGRGFLSRRAARGLEMLALASLMIGTWLGAGGVKAQTRASHSSSTEKAGVESAPALKPPEMGNGLFAHVLLDELEGRTNGPDNEFRWDGEAWIGTNTNRFWMKTEGSVHDGTVSDGELEALYDRPLPRLRYFDGQVGLREDLDSGPRRTWVAIGVEGLAPGFFQFEPTFYFRDGGRVAGRVVTSYDLLITQRLVAQPQLEMNFYNKDDPQRKLGSGLSDLDTGIRVRYEMWRKFAPYVGFTYTQEYGGTARFARQFGENTASPRFVFGVRVWY